eukprot:jgi/Psemu1/262777/estExt_Genewise1Plus.C_8410023
MYAGLLPVDVDYDGEPRGNLSFWLFNPDESKDSLTIWLNGGPGCSSYDAGLFLECGPVTYPHHPAGHGRTRADEPLSPNDYSWTKATNLLFVEQPVGTGFSYGSAKVDTEADVSADFYNFLVNFFATFEPMRDKSLYIVGESYAGMYVPSIAHYIHKQNQKGTIKKMNLSGIGLGNGWIDAMTQGPAPIDYAYWHGMIDSPSRDSLHKAWERCKKKRHMKAPFHDFTVTDECAIVESVLALAGAKVFPYGGDGKWQACIPGAGRRRRGLQQEATGLLPGQILLAHDQPESVAPYIAELLDDAGIRVLVYGGDRDLSVNLQGSEQVLNDMDWSGKKSWKSSNRYLWMVGSDVAGYVKTHKNLDMLLVLNSGHLVPFNVPVSGLDLIARLTGELPFGDILLPKLDAGGSKYTDFGFKSEESDSGLSMIFLAIACFSFGALMGLRCRCRKSSLQYQQIVDMT